MTNIVIDRLLIVGLGSIGNRHARLARQLMPSVEIVALRHRGGEVPPCVDRCVTSVEEALSFQPQAAVIANPASLHLEIAVPLARAGVHLLIEKPLSSTVDGISELLDMARERNIVLMTGYNMRFLPSLQRFRELLMENRCGRALSVRAEVGQYLPSWRPNSDYRGNVSAKAALGGGVLLELSHEIDYLRWIFGEIEWVNAVLRKQSDLEIDVEDTAHLIFGFAGFKGAGTRQLVATLNLDFIRRDTTRSCTVIGETGTLRWNALAGTVEEFSAATNAWQTVFSHQSQRDDSYLGEWHNFLDCIGNHKTPDISGLDGYAVIRVIAAARQSSATGTTVEVGKEDKNMKHAGVI